MCYSILETAGNPCILCLCFSKSRVKQEFVDERHNEDIEKAAEEVRMLIQEFDFFVKNRQMTLSSLSDIADILELLSDTIVVAVQTEKRDADEMEILNEKTKKAQKTLEVDKKLMSSIDNIYANLLQSVENLSHSRPELGNKSEEIISTLLVADALSQSATKTNSSTQAVAAACSILWSHTLLTADRSQVMLMDKIFSTCTPPMADICKQGLLESSTFVVESLLPTNTKERSELAYDTRKLVHTLVDLSDGSQYEASRILRNIVQRYEEQLREIVEFLKLLS